MRSIRGGTGGEVNLEICKGREIPSGSLFFFLKISVSSVYSVVYLFAPNLKRTLRPTAHNKNAPGSEGV